MTKIKKFLRLLGDCVRICMPDYWVLNSKYDETWNDVLNGLMKNFEFEAPTYPSDHTAMLGNGEIWVSNHPYASFTPHNNLSNDDVRPSRLTIVRARRKYLKDRMLWEEKKKQKEIAERVAKQAALGAAYGQQQTATVWNPAALPLPTYSYTYAASIPPSSSNMIRFFTGSSSTGYTASSIKSLDTTDSFKDKIRKMQEVEAKKVTRPVPDYIHTLVGWRGWKCVQGKLEALGASGLWNPKEAKPAVCVHQGNHAVPCQSCQCGYWSFKSLDLLLEAINPYTTSCAVVGQVEVWGRVIDCEYGFRSEFAYPKELWLLNDGLDFLGPLYGVPVKKYVDSKPIL